MSALFCGVTSRFLCSIKVKGLKEKQGSVPHGKHNQSPLVPLSIKYVAPQSCHDGLPFTHKPRPLIFPEVQVL